MKHKPLNDPLYTSDSSVTPSLSEIALILVVCLIVGLGMVAIVVQLVLKPTFF